MTVAPTRLAAALADRYRIERELGQGGMATVYLAHDIKHDRKVALKVLRPELAASLGHERFLREITTTANLRHPHILPLYDSGEADTFLYYVMPFVEGETLRDRLDREKQLPLDDARTIATELADALSYAHGRGVIHRDIKPENILLESGHAVVADFGITRAVTAAGAESLTQTGMAIGTPAYMSPEQAAGEQDLDGRSDLYALGCVTYEMLAGQPPFTGPTAASIVGQHLAVPPRPITELRAALPAAIAEALQRALAKSAADRFATPTAFAAALRADARPPAARLPRRVIAAAVAVLALAVAGVAWLALHGRRNTGLDSDVIAVLPFRVGGNPAPAYLRESMLDLLQARLSGATGPRTVEPRTLLAAWRRAVGNESEDLSEDASRELARSLGAGRVLLGSAIATPTELTLSGTLLRVSDGRQLARESVGGAPDSIAVLVNRLTAALLIGEAGEGRDRSAGLAAAPLDALQDYLAGRRAYRRGDYYSAMDLYSRAVARDSTFVDAAFAMVATNAWIGTVGTTAGFRAIPVVSRLRDRLSERDRSLFLAIPWVGPSYPRPSTNAEIIAQAQRGADSAADSPDHWLLLGQVLAAYGASASVTDWPARAAAALDRAIALDSSFALAIQWRIYAAMEAGDTAATRRYARLLEARVVSGFADDYLLWATARVAGDSAVAVRWRDRTEGMGRTDVIQKRLKLILHSAAFALPLADAHLVLEQVHRDATTDADRAGLRLGEEALGFAEGRTDVGVLSWELRLGSGGAGTILQQALIEPAYRPVAATVLAQERAGEFGIPGPSGSPTPGGARWPPLRDCYGTLLRVTGGDTIGAAAALARLRVFAATDHPPLPPEEWQHVDLRVCPLLLGALLERPAGGAARPSLERLDSLMREGPRGWAEAASVAPTAFANFAIARLREAQGDIPAALAAIRRREVDYFPAYLWSLPAFLRQEGRLAALAGDTTGARRAYDEYLTMRTDPDPPFRPQRDSVLAERSALGAK